MKLVFEYFEGSNYAGEWYNVCFEYESKEKFLFDIFEKSKGFDKTDMIIIFDKPIWIEQLNEIENNLYTLEEWHNKEMEFNKQYECMIIQEMKKK